MLNLEGFLEGDIVQSTGIPLHCSARQHPQLPPHDDPALNLNTMLISLRAQSLALWYLSAGYASCFKIYLAQPEVQGADAAAHVVACSLI